MGVAGLINVAMLIMAASAFYRAGLTHIASIEEAYRTLEPLLGIRGAHGVRYFPAGLRFGVSLRGDHGRTGDHAGVFAPANPHLGATPGDDGAVAGGHRYGSGSDSNTRFQSGGAEFWVTIRNCAAPLVYAPA